jgi:Arc/MetJ family transcription regulator
VHHDVHASIKMTRPDVTMTSMRTTIRIDDELYRTVRRQAAESGRTVGEIIEDAVRRALQQPATPEPLDALPTYGGSGVMPGVDLTSNVAVRDAMDEDAPLDALR